MKKTNLLILILLFASQSQSISQESSLNITVDYGQYDVGFKAFNEYDKTRSFSTDVNSKSVEIGKTISRPMQICVWYPAIDAEKTQMRYSDYFYLMTQETGKINLTEELKNKTIDEYIKNEGLDRSILENELNASMRAILERI